MDKIKDYFKRYPKSKEVFECGGLLFHSRGAAESYGKGEVKRHAREGVTGAAEASLPEVSGLGRPVGDKGPAESAGAKAKKDGKETLKRN